MGLFDFLKKGKVQPPVKAISHLPSLFIFILVRQTPYSGRYWQVS